METLQVVLASIFCFALCLALLNVAAGARVPRRRIALSSIAGIGLMLQGAIWSYVTCMLKALRVGGSYLWLYAALAVSVAGMVWALVLLGTTVFSRRFTG
jgi:hypothetical protein